MTNAFVIDTGHIKANNHDEFLEIQQELIEDGYVLDEIVGRNMKYSQRVNGTLYKVRIFMAFWEN